MLQLKITTLICQVLSMVTYLGYFFIKFMSAKDPMKIKPGSILLMRSIMIVNSTVVIIYPKEQYNVQISKFLIGVRSGNGHECTQMPCRSTGL